LRTSRGGRGGGLGHPKVLRRTHQRIAPVIESIKLGRGLERKLSKRWRRRSEKNEKKTGLKDILGRRRQGAEGVFALSTETKRGGKPTNRERQKRGG